MQSLPDTFFSYPMPPSRQLFFCYDGDAFFLDEPRPGMSSGRRTAARLLTSTYFSSAISPTAPSQFFFFCAWDGGDLEMG